MPSRFLNIQPLCTADVLRLHTLSPTDFHFEDINGQVLSMEFTSENDIDTFFFWLLSFAKNKTRISEDPMPGSIKAGNGYLSADPDYSLLERVNRSLIPQFKLQYLEKLKSDKFSKLIPSSGLSNEIEKLFTTNWEIDDAHYEFDKSGYKISLLIEEKRKLVIRITSMLNGIRSYSEAFVVKIPKNWNDALIADFIIKYLTDRKYRFEQIQASLEDFSLSLNLERDQQ